MIDLGERRRLLMLERMGITVWSQRRTVSAGAAGTALIAPPAEEPVAEPWEPLLQSIKACRRCSLCEGRRNAVPGVGERTAALLIVGEAPGADEDRSGEPFVGRAGQLLDQMLKAIHRRRDSDCFITNTVKCRPPGNRNPEPAELQACGPYLDAQIRLIKPRVIVALGLVAAQRLLATREPLHQLRGAPRAHPETGTPVLVTYHPAYLLRRPADKARAWADWKVLHRLLDGKVVS